MPLIFRIVKGEPLTFLEGDDNLRYLEGLTISSSADFSNWTGSVLSQFAGTASLALTASYALNAGTTVDTGSLITTESFNAFTSSYYNDSSSFDQRISNISFDSSSLATTESFNNFTSSYYNDSSSFDQRINSISFDSSSLVTTESFNTFTSSYNTGSFTGSFTGDLIGTASYVNLLAGPGIIINGLEITSSVQTVNGIFPTNGNIPIALSATITGTSASLVSSGSGTTTGSLPDGLIWIISNDPTPANNGDVYIYSSGSVGAWYQVAPLDVAASDARYIKLDGANTPMTGDLNMGGNNINNVGTMNGTASFAISASWAPSVPVDLGEYTATSSFNAFTSSYNTGSFSGSFTGQLIGTASWANNAITASFALATAQGAASTFIATGSVSASVDISGSLFRVTSGSTQLLNIGFPPSAYGWTGIQWETTANGINLTPSLGVLRLGTLTGNSIVFTTNITDRWVIGSTGIFSPVLNNAYDIGTSTNRVRNVFAAGLDVSGSGRFTNGLTVSSSTGNIFTVTTGSTDVFAVSSSGVTTIATSGSSTTMQMSIDGGLYPTFNTAPNTIFIFKTQNNNRLKVGSEIIAEVPIILTTPSAGTSTPSLRLAGVTNMNLAAGISGSVTGSVVITTGSLVAQNGLIVTGSFTVHTGITEFQVLSTGTKIGNVVTDIHTVTGSLDISGSATITNVLTLPYQDPLPISPATGSIALSGSGATFVGMFVWTGTWTQI